MSQEVKKYKDYIESNIKEYQEYQMKALNSEPEMTKRLASLLQESYSPDSTLSILDVGCGNGNTLFHLRRRFANWRMVGVDVVPALIESGKQLFAETIQADLRVADAHELDQMFGREFDIVMVWRVLQGLEDAYKALEIAAGMVKPGGRVIVSTLLNDSDVDIKMIMRDRDAEGAVKDVPLRIFSNKRFEAFCRSIGAVDYHSERFEMGVDLPKPEKGLNTYTLKLDGGGRTQLAGGAFIDHWKIATIYF